MRLLLSAILALGAFSSTGHGTILFNTFKVDPDGGTTNAIGGVPVQGTSLGNAQEAVQFVLSQTAEITQIDFDLAVTNTNPQVTDNDAFFQFFTNVAGIPGTQIGSVSIPVSSIFGSISTIQTAAVPDLILGPGTYWIVAIAKNAASSTVWEIPTPPTSGPWDQNLSGTGWNATPFTTFQPGVALEGQTVTPEPASGLLMLAGLMAALGTRRVARRVRRQSHI